MNILQKYNHFITSTDANDWRWYGTAKKPWMYPSNSSIQGDVLATPKQVQKWMMGIGQKKYDEHMAMTGSFGDTCHKFFEDALNGKEFEVVEAYKPHVSAFREWMAKHSVKPIATEFTVVSERYGFAGRVDALAEVDGRVELLDWKTGTKYRDSWASQCGGYHLALIEMLQGEGPVPLTSPKEGVDIGVRVVHIPRDTAKLKDFKYEHIDFIEDTFLLNLEKFKRAPNFNYLKKLGWKYVLDKSMIRNTNL